MLIVPLPGPSSSLHAMNSLDNMLILTKNKKEMLHNGKPVVAAQPFAMSQGTSYVALNGIAQPFGFKLSFDSALKESIAESGTMKLRFKWNSKQFIMNGVAKTWPEPTLLKNGSLMLPLQLWTEITASNISVKGNETIVRWKSAPPLTPLRVSDNGRYLVNSDGDPFFWLADTAWELFQRLNRTEVETYLKSSAEQDFTVILATALSEKSDLVTPNAQGDKPLSGTDPNKPLTTTGNDPASSSQYDYWDHVDYAIDTAAELGLYVGVLPTWGKYILDNSGWPYKQPYKGVFTNDNSYNYGKWIGSRYADRSNVIWVLGGDRAPDTEAKKELIRQMARGIKDSGAKQLITFHPIGNKSSSEWFHDEDWLDFNMYQSGHTSVDIPNYKVITSDYLKTPVKPTIDTEPRYEGHGINFNSANGRFTAFDIRQAAYWSVFSGSFGHTYGNHAIWQMHTSGQKADVSNYWYEALGDPGRSQMKYVRKLMESRPMLDRIPDQSLVTDALTGGNHIRATRGTNYAMVYSPKGAAFTVRMEKITGDAVTASWYNPRTGVSTSIGEYANAGTRYFQPPSSGTGNDWILILDDASAGFSAP